MPSLRELQIGFADALFADGTRPPFATLPDERGAERFAVYRRALFANYGHALCATYPVIRKLVGAAFFDAAVKAFVRDHPPTSGDLNVYGDAFPRFSTGTPSGRVAVSRRHRAARMGAGREANRAAEADTTPEQVLAMLADNRA
jgi:hypothetical protein